MSDWTNLYAEKNLPLIYKAAKNNFFGTCYQFEQSAITDALFVYLEGSPENSSISKLKEFIDRPIVCMSYQWEQYLKSNYKSIITLERFCMKEKKEFCFEQKVSFQKDFHVLPFTEDIFNKHPFSQAENYSSFEEFQKTGSGAVVIYKDEIVCSASSFLSYGGEIELDVSTKTEFRKKGLATVCVNSMLKDCLQKDFTVHWDAQNLESKQLAQKFGFELKNKYNVYVIKGAKMNTKIIAICGKICSGKSYYANELKQNYDAIILSCDELTKDLFDNNLGKNHDEMMSRIKNFYKKQSIELIRVGCNVILDWGFWCKKEREELTAFYKSKNIELEWHYIDVQDKTWQKNIENRNRFVASGTGGSNYYIDEGLLQKILSNWEEPTKEEIDVWHNVDG